VLEDGAPKGAPFSFVPKGAAVASSETSVSQFAKLIAKSHKSMRQLRLL
jgi:hypothetical protein